MLKESEKREEFRKLMHDLNLSWGKITNTVVDNRSWSELPSEEQQEKIKQLRLILNDRSSCSTPEKTHENWRLTAKKDHPCDIPYQDLPFHQKVKDEIFLFVLKLWDDSLKCRA